MTKDAERTLENAKWRSIPNGNGERKGLNRYDEIAFGLNPINSLVRELGQNSLDAKLENDKPVGIEFNWFNIRKEVIPDYQEYESILKLCLKSNETDLDCQPYFKRALEILNSDIPVMRISDFNTRGLTGADTAADDSDWLGAVKKDGYSKKRKNASTGGSFGIGKAVAYACSNLGTVFFSSLDVKDIRSTIGVGKLVTFTKNGEDMLSTVYCADSDKNALLESFSFDTSFTRKFSGTDIFILGFNQDENLEQQIIKAALNNFLIALCEGKLYIKIGDTVLNKETIDGIIQNLDKDDKDTQVIITYYNLFAHQLRDIQKYTLDDVDFCRNFGVKENDLTLLLCEGEGFNRKILCSRAKGMTIMLAKGWPRGKDFTGILYVTGEALNKLLLLMETPAHDKWDPKIGRTKEEIKLLDNCRKGLRNFILSKINKAFFSQVTDSIDAFGAGDFLPDTDAMNGQTKIIAPSLEIKVKEVSINKNSLTRVRKSAVKAQDDIINDLQQTGLTEAEVESVKNDLKGTKQIDINNDHNQTKTTPINSLSDASGDATKSDKPLMTDMEKYVIRTGNVNRVIGTDAKQGEYCLIFSKTGNKKDVYVELDIVGEQSDVPAVIIEASVMSGNATIKEFGGNKIYLQTKSGKQVIRLKFKVDYNEYCVWDVKYYEAKN